MGVSTRPKRKRGGPRFAMLKFGMMDSPAWRALSGDAVKLLLAVWRRYNGHNNGEISYGIREAAELLDRDKNTIMRRFQELVDKGFLAIESKGAFSVKTKMATVWRITLEPAGGTPATLDYQRWRPEGSISE